MADKMMIEEYLKTHKVTTCPQCKITYLTVQLPENLEY